MASGPFSKLYHALLDDYPAVWNSDPQLVLFVRLLVVADKYFPNWAPIGRRNGAYQSLLKAGLVLENEWGTGYTIRGLNAEHERRSHAASIAARTRWGMPKRRDEMRRDGIAMRSASANGSPAGGQPQGMESVRKHYGQHVGCTVCAPLQAQAEKDAMP
jgi:hypothetical protein